MTKKEVLKAFGDLLEHLQEVYEYIEDENLVEDFINLGFSEEEIIMIGFSKKLVHGMIKDLQ